MQQCPVCLWEWEVNWWINMKKFPFYTSATHLFGYFIFWSLNQKSHSFGHDGMIISKSRKSNSDCFGWFCKDMDSIKRKLLRGFTQAVFLFTQLHWNEMKAPITANKQTCYHKSNIHKAIVAPRIALFLFAFLALILPHATPPKIQCFTRSNFFSLESFYFLEEQYLCLAHPHMYDLLLLHLLFGVSFADFLSEENGL